MPDHVTERESGVTAEHTTALEGLMTEINTFLFLRPTEFDTTILIKEGYATKSMDIHDKSSNWGPMAGFVPCDPAFCKKLIGTPNPHIHPHAHGDSYPVQLFMKDSLVGAHTKMTRIADPRRIAPGSAAKTLAPLWVTLSYGRHVKIERYYKGTGAAGPTPESVVFCLGKQGSDWLVWWALPPKTAGETMELHPLWVWAYRTPGKLNPVTGDYDMWMVAPHVTRWRDAVPSTLVIDSHGKSAASKYTTDLVVDMNRVCLRAANPVFNHGAESQNYGFTQALDRKLAMYTPGGSSRMIAIEDMPGVLADIQSCGYLVLWNKRYAEIDARLMGAGRTLPWQVLAARREGFRRALTALRATEVATGAPVSASGTAKTARAPQRTALVKARWNLVSAAVKLGTGTERAYIVRFVDELREALNRAAGWPPSTLKPEDFPAKQRQANETILDIQRSLQLAGIYATTGEGENRLDAIETWATENAAKLEALMAYWAPPTPVATTPATAAVTVTS